jgi:hypothetical protein
MSNHPTHRLYFVRKFKRAGEEQSQWVECGAGWLQQDGEGVSLSVTQLPIGFFAEGRLVLRAIPEAGEPEA